MNKIIKAKDLEFYMIDDQGNHIKVMKVANLTIGPNLVFKESEQPTLVYTQKEE